MHPLQQSRYQIQFECPMQTIFDHDLLRSTKLATYGRRLLYVPRRYNGTTQIISYYCFLSPTMMKNQVQTTRRSVLLPFFVDDCPLFLAIICSRDLKFSRTLTSKLKYFDFEVLRRSSKSNHSLFRSEKYFILRSHYLPYFERE
jgi:hypothetical protein